MAALDFSGECEKPECLQGPASTHYFPALVLRAIAALKKIRILLIYFRRVIGCNGKQNTHRGRYCLVLGQKVLVPRAGSENGGGGGNRTRVRNQLADRSYMLSSRFESRFRSRPGNRLLQKPARLSRPRLPDNWQGPTPKYADPPDAEVPPGKIEALSF